MYDVSGGIGVLYAEYLFCSDGSEVDAASLAAGLGCAVGVFRELLPLADPEDTDRVFAGASSLQLSQDH